LVDPTSPVLLTKNGPLRIVHSKKDLTKKKEKRRRREKREKEKKRKKKKESIFQLSSIK